MLINLFSRCSLGDITNDDSCYEKALEVSNNKSARAKVIFSAFNQSTLACF